MKLFRKKPIVIEAIQITQDNEEGLKLLAANHSESETPMELIYDEHGKLRGVEIMTLESGMLDLNGELNDWVIRGVKRELYPCKPDIFKMTYEPAGTQ